MSRLVYVLLGIIIAGTSSLMLSHLSRPQEAPVVGALVVVDSSRVGEVGDSVERLQLRHRLDSLQAWIDTAQPVKLWGWLPGGRDTLRDTLRVEVPVQVLRETADSLAQCQHDRDSVTGDVLVCRERVKAHTEAFRLCQQALGGMPAPSHGGTAWTASLVLQADGESLRPGMGVDWRQGRLSVGAEGYARANGTRPGLGLRFGFNFGGE